MKLPSVYPLTSPSSHRMISRIAMVSSMLCLRSFLASSSSNARATARPAAALLVLVAMLATVPPARAQTSAPSPSRSKAAGLFLGGAAVGLAAHESGHLVFDLLFDADPGIAKV